MTFTTLHRPLGLAPSPLTDDLLDAAVAAGVVEASDLDWKGSVSTEDGAGGLLPAKRHRAAMTHTPRYRG